MKTSKLLIGISVLLTNFYGFSYICIANTSPQCGPESLLLVAQERGIKVTLDTLKKLTGTDQTGTTLLGLLTASNKINLPAVSLKLTPKQYAGINEPMIAWVDSNHYLVVWECTWFGKQVVIQDFPGQRQTVSMKDFALRWSGEALVFSDALKRRFENNKIVDRAKKYPGPHVWCDETVLFTGTVEEGETVKHIFTLENTGIDTLVLNARSSCSCTAAMLFDRFVPPGCEGKIEVKFDTTGKHGSIQQSIDVRTNDATQPWVRLTLVATVQQSVKVLPPKVWLDEIPYNNTVERIVRVLGPDDGTFAIDQIETLRDIDTDIGLAVTDSLYGFHIPIKLTYKAGISPKSINEKISIILKSGQLITLPITGKVVGHYRANPPVALFGIVNPGAKISRDITLIPTGTFKTGCSSIPLHFESSLPAVTAAIISQSGGKSILRITLDVSTESTISDTLRVYHLKEAIPTLIIPVFAQGGE